MALVDGDAPRCHERSISDHCGKPALDHWLDLRGRTEIDMHEIAIAPDDPGREALRAPLSLSDDLLSLAFGGLVDRMHQEVEESRAGIEARLQLREPHGASQGRAHQPVQLDLELVPTLSQGADLALAPLLVGYLGRVEKLGE